MTGPIPDSIRSIDVPRAIALVFGITVISAILVSGALSAAAFAPYNPGWDGTSEFRSDLASDPAVDVQFGRTTDAYTDTTPAETVAIVIAPERAYDGEDAARVERFVRDGGTLVVFENFDDGGNELLAAIDAESRFHGQLLRDEREYANAPTMPLATPTEDVLESDSIGANGHSVETVTLNYATAIATPTATNATVLATTSDYAYLGDEDTDLDEVEDVGTYPVAVSEPLGDGSVIVVGDPSILINAMYDTSDNAAFVASLYDEHDTVVLDASHGPSIPPVIAVLLVLRESIGLQVLLGAILVASVWIGSTVDGRSIVDQDTVDDETAFHSDSHTVTAPTRQSSPSVAGQTDRPVTGNQHARHPNGSKAGRHGVTGSPREVKQPTLSFEERVEMILDRYPHWERDRVERMIRGLNIDYSQDEDE